MKHSESIKNLAAALATAQAEMPAVQMNSENPFLHNKFADLGAVITASRPVLAKNGLSVSQFPTSDGDRVGVTTILMHASGEWIENTAMLMTEQEKGRSAAQVAGSIITYLRRYSWSAVLGMHSEEDTDGNGNKPASAPKQEKKQSAWSAAQKAALIENALAGNDFAARGMLDLSCLPPDASPDVVKAWGEQYRSVRKLKPDENDFTAQAAAEFANNWYEESKKG